MKYEPVIGLEIHIQLNTESKMFCSCDNFSVRSKPNTNVCPICLGLPGTLPVANKKAIENVILLGLALNGKVSKKFNFERKNYFYPDLPKAYQITSSTDFPVEGGYLEVDAKEPRNIKIHHIHLEEDAGKLIHVNEHSLVDLNRAGTPLIELVTEPDIKSPLEAKLFVQNLRSIVKYLGISDANMEEGNLRCDANISLREIGETKLGSKVEIKNLNSFKMIERAIEFEIERQSVLLDSNTKIVQETRGWDDAKGKTLSQRLKEEALDYRYFPEPDLPSIEIDAEGGFDLERLREILPELPKEKEERFTSEYGLSKADAINLVQDLEIAKYYEKVIESMPEFTESSESLKDRAKKAANWIITELFGRLNANKLSFEENKISPKQLAQLLELIESGSISGKIAKEVFDEMFTSGSDPEVIVKKKGLEQVSDTGEIENIIKKVISENVKVVEEYKSGKVQVIGFLVGQVMKETGGRANPKMVNELLKKELN